MMKRMVFAAVALMLLGFVSGCTDAARGKFGSLGAKHRVELYSGGEKVREWITTGKPLNEQSDGYFFVDSESGELVRVTGDLVVTQLK